MSISLTIAAVDRICEELDRLQSELNKLQARLNKSLYSVNYNKGEYNEAAVRLL
jgi:hypothetical protein